MNYYEELGIRRDATTGEIREAYKLVARLLHPDKQREPRLKDLAECQMKRMSDVVAVLLNPQERARYDAELANGPRLERLEPQTPPIGPGLLQTVVRNWFWVLLASMTIGMGVWYSLARGPDAPPGSAAAAGAMLPAAPAVAPSERTMTKRRVKPADAPGAPRAVPPLTHPAGEEPEQRLSAEDPTPAETPAKAETEKQRGVPADQKAAPADVARSGGVSRFAGEWLYTADEPDGGRAGKYPATYVEFRLREESGMLAGGYRALHRVVDKAISPEVSFRVHGASPAGNKGNLGWESSAGAKGEVELTLLSPSQLQVKWWTTQFGRQEALSSGMAVLMRLKTP